MNHTAICIDCKFYVREKWLDEERNQEGHKKGSQEGSGQEKEVTTTSRASGII